MRLNVYSQEITDEVYLIRKESNTGISYYAVQYMLHSSPLLHHTPEDDDRSAVTFWLPKSAERREALAYAFEKAAHMVRIAPAEVAPCGHELADPKTGYACLKCGVQLDA